MDEPEPAFPVEPPEHKAAHKKPKMGWLAAALAGTGAALATSLPAAYFGYKSTRTEASSNKEKAEVGYQTLVDAVKQHEAHDLEQDKWIFKLEGHIEALEASLARKAIETGDGSGFGSGAGHHGPTAGKPAASTGRILPPSQYKGVQLPDTLDSAFKAAAKK